MKSVNMQLQNQIWSQLSNGVCKKVDYEVRIKVIDVVWGDFIPYFRRIVRNNIKGI